MGLTSNIIYCSVFGQAQLLARAHFGVISSEMKREKDQIPAGFELGLFAKIFRNNHAHVKLKKL